MTHATEPNPPESDRPSQRRAYPLFSAEDETRVVPALPVQRREPSRPMMSTAPDGDLPGGAAVALLAFTAGSMTGAVVTVDPQTAVTIGRGDRSTVQIDDDTVFRVHARIHRVGSTVTLTDVGSTNGTFVNGQRVKGVVSLRSGDSVRVGTRHGFRFLLGDEQDLRALSAAYECATRDTLTGLLNRRMFDQALDGEIAFAQRHGTPLAVLLIDVDHFKRVNDSHGHAAGDSVLRAIGQQLREAVRAEDIAARIGGEEFGIVVRDADKASVLALAQRLASLIGRIRVQAAAAEVGVTVSIGVASIEESQDTGGAVELMRLADVRLYAAKRTRNCVVAR